MASRLAPNNEAEQRRKRDYMCYSHSTINYNMGAIYCVLYMEDHMN